MRMTVTGSLLFFAVYGAAGQSAAAFDVASVKPAVVAASGEGRFREDIQATPGSLAMRNVTMASAIQWAYNVKPFQVSGPDWITGARYDIAAKAADGAPEAQLRTMLQKLLADRFRLTLHHESREIPVYAMVVGKSGPKFHAAEKGAAFAMTPGKGGKMAIDLHSVSMAQFSDFLSKSPLQRPVLDETGLPGTYDLTLDLMPYLDAAGGPSGPSGTPSSQDKAERERVGLSDMAGIIATAIQEELGLKLESKKSAADVLVIDRAEKVPAEN